MKTKWKRFSSLFAEKGSISLEYVIISTLSAIIGITLLVSAGTYVKSNIESLKKKIDNIDTN